MHADNDLSLYLFSQLDRLWWRLKGIGREYVRQRGMATLSARSGSGPKLQVAQLMFFDHISENAGKGDESCFGSWIRVVSRASCIGQYMQECNRTYNVCMGDIYLHRTLSDRTRKIYMTPVEH